VKFVKFDQQSLARSGEIGWPRRRFVYEKNAAQVLSHVFQSARYVVPGDGAVRSDCIRIRLDDLVKQIADFAEQLAYVLGGARRVGIRLLA
jgi:hypothetical protein